jgi:hypothetical protein
MTLFWSGELNKRAVKVCHNVAMSPAFLDNVQKKKSIDDYLKKDFWTNIM